ncbi:MAG: exo-alpha-sialidase [Bacteroidota bacterium]
MPDLHVTATNQAYLSWIEFVNDSTDVLAFATLDKEEWSAPKIIAQGSDWFVNWADFPSLTTFDGSSSNIAAHWLQKSAAGTYDYDIKISLSNDGGQDWRAPFIPHTDGIAAEHGFVSMQPVGSKVFVSWLDGRYTKTENNSDGHDHEGQGGAMTLRGAFFDENGQLSGDIELDDKVCDCCATSAALTKNGIIVAYRDRLAGEIRDISIVRQIDRDWTRPRRLSTDNWEIAGCPVNGPKIATDEDQIVGVAWFTMAQDTPKVNVAISSDAGANFGPPIRIDNGNPIGRVDLIEHEKTLYATWLEKIKEEEATINLVKISLQGTDLKKLKIATTSSARSSGFPVLERWGNRWLVAWTEIIGAKETTIKTALVDF